MLLRFWRKKYLEVERVKQINLTHPYTMNLQCVTNDVWFIHVLLASLFFIQGCMSRGQGKHVSPRLWKMGEGKTICFCPQTYFGKNSKKAQACKQKCSVQQEGIHITVAKLPFYLLVSFESLPSPSPLHTLQSAFKACPLFPVRFQSLSPTFRSTPTACLTLVSTS